MERKRKLLGLRNAVKNRPISAKQSMLFRENFALKTATAAPSVRRKIHSGNPIKCIYKL